MKSNVMMTNDYPPRKRHHAFKPKSKEHIEKVKEFKAFYGKKMIAVRDRYLKLKSEYMALRKTAILNIKYIDSDLDSRLGSFLNNMSENLSSINEMREELNEVYKELTMVLNIFPKMVETDLDGRDEVEEIIDRILFDIEDCEESWAREADLFYYEIEKQKQKHMAVKEEASEEELDDAEDNSKKQA